MLPGKSTINSRHDIVCVDSFILFFSFLQYELAVVYDTQRNLDYAKYFVATFLGVNATAARPSMEYWLIFCISNSLTLLALAIDRSTAFVINSIVFIKYKQPLHFCALPIGEKYYPSNSTFYEYFIFSKDICHA